MAKQSKSQQELKEIVKTVLSVPLEEITCDECFEVIDQYVDMLRTGQDPAVVLPKVQEHLNQCHCCGVEFRALISILEAATNQAGEDSSP